MGPVPQNLLVLLLFTLFVVVGSHCANSSFSFRPTCYSDDLTALNGFLNNLEAAPHIWGKDGISDCCKWEGITCGEDSLHAHVISLELAGKKLTGKLSGSLSGLVHLKTLNLSFNYLTGSVPSELFRFPNLRVLDLSGNHFSGALPADIYLPRIKILDISDNSFSGVLKSWGDMFNFSTALESVHLSQNHFSGEIPVGFGNNKVLDSLSLGSNLFTGNLPYDLFRLQALTRLDISNNKLSGTLNPNFGNLSSLIHLDLSSNNFLGKIPDIFQNLKKLKKFLAGSNNLSGHLPVSLTNSPSISTIGLNNNSLSGPISAINCSAMVSLSYLSLSVNNFVGPIPSDLSLCQRLQVLMLSRIKLNSQIPESFKTMKALTVLSVSNSSLYNLSSALSILQHCKNLTHLILTINFMTESMPVDPTLRFDNVKALVIADCGLTGSIPSWLTHSTNLHLLDLSWNRLSGNIPTWFNNLELIFYLDLSYNSLHGEIPESLTQLRGLTYVQVQDPPIDPIPFFLKKNQSLPALQYNRIWSFRPTLDLSHNKLVGQISINFGKLRTLHVLDLSHNMVTGQIPSNLSNMSSLEVMDLSYNSLSGNIPLSLQLLSFLSQFNVAHNNLTGRIPTGGQFLTFPNSSFEGNQGLCNALLTQCCDESYGNVLNNKAGEEEEDNELDLESSIFGLQFVIGVIVGFVVAVVGVELYGFHFCKERKRNHDLMRL